MYALLFEQAADRDPTFEVTPVISDLSRVAQDDSHISHVLIKAIECTDGSVVMLQLSVRPAEGLDPVDYRFDQLSLAIAKICESHPSSTFNVTSTERFNRDAAGNTICISGSYSWTIQHSAEAMREFADANRIDVTTPAPDVNATINGSSRGLTRSPFS